ncbi:MAG: MATE family efflux transporter [Melioribacteraceae bacterium]|nr:MATE family efflux transporter [Melioribacteraceae bacterium]
MTYKQHISETIKLAIPVSIGFLGHVMLGVVDSLMIGKIGASYLAASALVNSVLFLILVLGIGMTVAMTPLTAIANGSGNHEECGVILRQGLLTNIVFAVLLAVAVYYIADLLKFMEQPEEVVELASSYMKILSFSIIPFLVFQTYRQFIEGLENTRPAMYINIIANFVNAFGNWVLIYGNLGMPRLELDGAGYASLTTRVFIAVAMAYYVIKSPKYSRYDPSLRFKSINYKMIKKIINIGLPTGMQMFFEVGAFSFAAIMIGWIGTDYLAAHQIAISLASITFMIILGIASAATIRVGNYLGKKDFVELNKASNSSLLIAVIVMASFGVIFIALNNFLPTLFIQDPEVTEIASVLLIFAAFFQIFDGTQATGLGILRGMTDVKNPMITAFIAYWIVGIPLAYFLGVNLDYKANGVWFSLSLGLVLAALFFTYRIRKNIKNYLLNETA